MVVANEVFCSSLINVLTYEYIIDILTILEICSLHVKKAYMLVTTLNSGYFAFCPTPENYETEKDYLDAISSIVEDISDAIYIENKLLMQGIDLSLTDEAF